MADEIDIAFGFDATYAPHGAAVIASVVRHAPGARFRFLMLHTGMPDALRAQVEAAAPGHRFVWAEVRDEDLPDMGEHDNLGHVKKATFLRLLMETLAPADCRRIIYLDADIIVLRDIRELWRADLGDAPLGGVPDTFVDEDVFAKTWDLPPRAGGYFNAGILLIDLERVRAEHLFEKALRFVLEKNPGFADQDALNWVSWDRWRHLDAAWNVQRDMILFPERLPAVKRYDSGNPGIVHFTGRDKPWLRDAWHPWSWIYWDNLARTPFLSEIAQRHNVNAYRRLRMQLRWLRRRPRAQAA